MQEVLWWICQRTVPLLWQTETSNSSYVLPLQWEQLTPLLEDPNSLALLLKWNVWFDPLCLTLLLLHSTCVPWCRSLVVLDDPKHWFSPAAPNQCSCSKILCLLCSSLPLLCFLAMLIQSPNQDETSTLFIDNEKQAPLSSMSCTFSQSPNTSTNQTQFLFFQTKHSSLP